jgi:hypothetical protein
LREKRPRKKWTPKSGRIYTAIAPILLATLEIKLTLAQDRIEEVDQAAEAMADFIDTSTVSNNEYIQNARTIMKQAKQKLYDTRNTLLAEMVSAPNPTTTNSTRKEIQQESQKVIKEIRAEKERANISIDDKMRATREDLQRRLDRVTDKISGLGIDTMDNIDIKSATALNMAGLTVDSIVNGTGFETTLNQRMDAYIGSYPPTMEDSMMKFTELYFNNNDTLGHYIRDIAGSTMDLGAYKDQLDREIHQAATRWMDKNMREETEYRYWYA